MILTMKTSIYKIARLVTMGLAFTSFSSCKKKIIKAPPVPTYEIEGHLYRDCDMEPVEGLEIFLLQNAPNGFITRTTSGGPLDSCVTDSTGYYKFNFTDKKGDELYIRYRAGYGYNTIHDYLPKETSFYNYDLFIFPTFNIEVSLNVINPYTENDTLIIQDYATQEGFRIPGPFKSGLAFRTEDGFLFDMSLKENNFTVIWNLLPYRGVTFAEYFSIYEYCNNTVYVTIDIE